MHENDREPVAETATIEDLDIQELEDVDAPWEWACLTSTSCKCTSSSCAAWSV